MDRSERFFKVKNLLRARRFVTRAEFLAELEVSPATFKRDIEYLRENMRFPIVWDAEHQACRMAGTRSGTERHELPRLWFSSA